MNTVPVMSKITERGQITLPKRFRDAPVFREARAVEFTEGAGTIIIRPVKSPSLEGDDYYALLNHTMSDWSDPAHDDLFKFTKEK